MTTTGILASNPVARFIAAFVLSLCLVASIDAVSASVALLLEMLVIAFLRIPPRMFWLRTAPMWVAAPFSALTIALYGRASGTVFAEFGLVRVSEGSLQLAVATGLRILSIGLPAVVLFMGVDPTRLADGLIQRLKLPPRPVVGALAGMRLLTMFGNEWRTLETARRARGVADRGRLRRYIGQSYALLVLSIRHGSTLATAMEARGFGSRIPRSAARDSPWGALEWWVIAGGAFIGATAVTLSLATGSWNPIVG